MPEPNGGPSMQISKTTKRPHTDRVRNVRRVIGLGLATLFGGAWVACAPGDLPPGYQNWGGAGGSGSGGSAGESGGGGDSGGGGMPGGDTNPYADKCEYKTQKEAEEKLILPRCGNPGGTCHATTFPPKFSEAGKIA